MALFFGAAIMCKSIGLICALSICAIVVAGSGSYGQPNPRPDSATCGALCLKTFGKGIDNVEANLSAIRQAVDESERTKMEACIRQRLCPSTTETCNTLCAQALASKLNDDQKRGLAICLNNKLCTNHSPPSRL